jgi:plasmid stability protein
MLLRVDEALHAALRERAAAQGRSVNALVNEILSAAVANGRAPSRLDRVRSRAAALGLLAPPLRGLPKPATPEEYAATIASTKKGLPPIADELIEYERGRLG